MKFFGKKGNVPAMLLVTVLILGVILVANVYFSPSPRLVRGSVSEIRNEVSFSIDKSIALGIDKLMRHGDANMTDYWYCNMALPPDAIEIIEASEVYFRQDLNRFIEELKEEKNIEIADGWRARLVLEGIEEDSGIYRDVQQILDLFPDKNATVRISDLYGRYTDGAIIKEVDLSQDVIVNYRIWYFYKKLVDWINNDAAGLTQNACERLNSSPCQLSKSTCEVGHPADPNNVYITDGMIESLFPLEEMLNKTIQQSVDSLNMAFKDDETNIVCTFTLKDTIENLEFQRLQYCMTDPPACGGVRKCNMEGLTEDYMCPMETCSDEFDQEYTPECPDSNEWPTPRNEWIFEPPNSTNSPFPALTSISEPPDPELNPTDILVSCGAEEFKTENVTVRPEITGSFAVECRDLETRILRPESFGYLTNIVKLRLALKLNCECNNGTPGDSGDDQLGCGDLPGDTQGVFREIPCGEFDPPLSCIKPPGPPGEGCSACIAMECVEATCNDAGRCIKNDDGQDLGACPLECLAPCPGAICDPPCSTRSNNCWDYDCIAGVCVPTNFECGTSGFCYDKGCEFRTTGLACNDNSFNADCRCFYNETPEHVTCDDSRSPCNYAYCSTSYDTCRDWDDCDYQNACKKEVCINEGLPTEACIQEYIHECTGAPDGDPCTRDLASCATCSSSDPDCTDADRTARWTCYELRCNRGTYVGCEADPDAPGGYRCIEPGDGGG